MRTDSVPILLLTMVIAGCSSTHDLRSGGPAETFSSGAALEPQVEVDVAKPISGQATISRVLFFRSGDTDYADGVTFVSGGLLDIEGIEADAQRAAAQAACGSGESDFIIDPRYRLEVFELFPFYKSVRATVRGYPAKITGYRQVPREVWESAKNGGVIGVSGPSPE